MSGSDSTGVISKPGGSQKRFASSAGVSGSTGGFFEKSGFARAPPRPGPARPQPRPGAPHHRQVRVRSGPSPTSEPPAPEQQWQPRRSTTAWRHPSLLRRGPTLRRQDERAHVSRSSFTNLLRYSSLHGLLGIALNQMFRNWPFFAARDTFTRGADTRCDDRACVEAGAAALTPLA